jgi:phosphatidyl-myo-inositol dimannoside synthase
MTPERPLGSAGVVAITFHPRGGGIAAVSRLTVDALRDATGHPPLTLALTHDPRDGSFATGIVARSRFGMRVAAATLTRQCDWLLFTHLSLAAVQRALPPWARLPYGVFLHDVEAWQPLSAVRSRILANAFVRIANSEYTARRVAEANPAVGPIVACPLALSAEWSAIASAGPVPTAPPRTVLIVGRMVASERYKGHDQLLDAWPSVMAQMPTARLICVGEGDDVGRLKARVADLGVASAVEFTGFVSEDDRRRHYRQAAVFAMPSRREGFGLVYLEAMASGLPCLGSVHDAASSVIANGDTGWLVDQSDIRALSSRLVQLLVHEEERRAMGEAGRRRFLEQFTFESFTDRLRATIARARSAPQPAPLADAHASRFVE